jgi:hypothetical protein
MNKRNLHIVCTVFRIITFSCLTNSIFAQSETQLRTLFNNYSRTGIHEEIFVHCDKDFYLTNEICWFKLYCMDAFWHHPITISKLAYWELLDRYNTPLAQLKIALQDGCGNGSYQLPQNLNSGTYRIRCYTNWMKNFDAGFYFEKEITVINSQQFYQKDTLEKEHTCSIRFYPEGGNLVNTIPSTVAFKISDAANKGVNGYGYVIDDLNDTLRMIRTLRAGIGKFVLTPQSKRSYKAIILLPNAEKIIAELPKAYDNGYVMHLSDSGDFDNQLTDGNRLSIKVQTKGDQFSSGLVYLFVHTRGSVKIVQGNLLQNNQALFVIDKNRLGDGISHLTIFDAQKHPVCERLYFKYPIQRLNIQVSSNKDTYSPREKIEATVNTKEDTSSQPANLSMAVYKIDTLQPMDNMTIENYIWLSADLPETIESPAYYFDSSNEDRGTALDNLLLTQGWRRFRWEDILREKTPGFKFLPEYTGHIIMGRVFDSATKMPARSRGVFVSSPGPHTVFNASNSDSSGMLRFDMKDFYTNGELIIRSEKSEDSILSIEVQSPFSDAFSHKPPAFFSFAKLDTVALSEYHKDIVVQWEYLKSQLRKFALPVVDTLPFFGKPDVSYLLDDYVRFTTMEEVLREYVAQTSVRNRAGRFEVSVWDGRRGQSLLEPAPLVLLDGVPTNINAVMSYDPLKVKRLDIVTETYFYGNMSFGGVLSFATYNGDLPGFDLDPHTIVMDYAGLEAHREFYSPPYNTREEVDSRLPDFRRLLYWQPTVVTNRQGNNTQSFFSSDLPGKYVIVVQGISPDGKIGYGRKTFTVAGK